MMCLDYICLETHPVATIVSISLEEVLDETTKAGQICLHFR